MCNSKDWKGDTGVLGRYIAGCGYAGFICCWGRFVIEEFGLVVWGDLEVRVFRGRW